MDPALIASVSSISGVIIGALLAGWQQKANTKALIESEFRKLNAQFSAENFARVRARKEEWLLEAVPPLVAAVDPELHADFDYNKVVSLIHRIQVVIDPQSPKEAKVNDATTQLGFAVQAVKCKQAPRESLLHAQAALIEATRDCLRGAP
jgi:hypothetical protein